LATIELSTPFAEHGPQYPTTIVTLAAGLSFNLSVAHNPLSALMG
jgi:hypothetical protein